MADLNKVRLQVIDPATGAVVDTVDAKTSDGAVYLQDGTTLKNWIANADREKVDVRIQLYDLAQNLGGSDALAQKAYSDVSYEENTGKLTFKTNDGQTKVIDTALEKIAVNFTLEDRTLGDDDHTTKVLVLELTDGSEMVVPVTDLIDIYTGSEGTQIVTSVNESNEISATIVAGSITMNELAEDVLAAIAEQYELVAATKTTLGGVIVGNGLSVDETGKISTSNIKLDDQVTDLKITTQAPTAVITVTAPTADAVITATAGVPKSITVNATSTGEAALAYKWYSKAKEAVAFTAIEGAASATYSITEPVDGTAYYCVVSAEGADPVATPIQIVKITA